MPDTAVADPQAAAAIAAADVIAAATQAAPDPAPAAPAVAAAQPAAPAPGPAAPAAAGADPARTDAEPQAKPPEQYALTLPSDALLAPETVTHIVATVTAEAQALGLTQAQAQQLATARRDMVAAAQTAINRDYAEVRGDPELGGAHFETTVKSVQTAMTYLFGDDVGAAQDVFTRFGLANNKVLVKGLAKLGHNLKEDSPIHPGRADVTAKRSPEEVLYGKSA